MNLCIKRKIIGKKRRKNIWIPALSKETCLYIYIKNAQNKTEQFKLLGYVLFP